ncbi:MAG: hypothetical protein KKF26_03310 [Chloroflexi bacterium]|nr:hypothetical protein [Chloroflexota bacterium]
MRRYRASRGQGRTRVSLWADYMGSDLVVCIYNEGAHLGAVAVAEYDFKEERACSSVITRLGHRDDEVAKKQAHIIARQTKQPVCVIAGIHLDDITQEEIVKILAEVDKMVSGFIRRVMLNNPG